MAAQQQDSNMATLQPKQSRRKGHSTYGEVIQESEEHKTRGIIGLDNSMMEDESQFAGQQ